MLKVLNFKNLNKLGKSKSKGMSVQSIIVGSVISRVIARGGIALIWPRVEKTKSNTVGDTHNKMMYRESGMKAVNNEIVSSNASEFKEKWFKNTTNFNDSFLRIYDKSNNFICSAVYRMEITSSDEYDNLLALEKNYENSSWFKEVGFGRLGMGTLLIHSTTCRDTVITNLETDINSDSSHLGVTGDYNLVTNYTNYNYELIDASK